MASSSSSVIDVGYNLTMREEDIADVSSALIFRVPKTRRIYNDHLYSPQLVSIGPFHHGKEELKDMEKSKSEAFRRMQKRIQKSIYTEYSSIKSIVEVNIVHKNKEIREFYGEDIHYRPMELANGTHAHGSEDPPSVGSRSTSHGASVGTPIKTIEPSYSAIHLIRFVEKNSTVYLPELRITAHAYSTMRNIIAMEVNTPAVYNEHIKSRYHPKRMTQFGIFMDELIDNGEDVDVLRKAEVIGNFLEGNRQVADLFNTLTKGIAHDWRCNVI
ncbi:hypothetical protein SUGI_0700080 [Cryptomeria japonica]|nr:hypothetical protein SUGI_0700080 [Cryptomeria japonica]